MFIITENGKNLFPERKFVTEEDAWKTAILECECENWEVIEDNTDDECECNEDWESLPDVLDGQVKETWKLDVLLAKATNTSGIKDLKEYAIRKIQTTNKVDSLLLMKSKVKNYNFDIKVKKQLLGLIEGRLLYKQNKPKIILEGKMKAYALKIDELKQNQEPFLVRVKHSFDETLTFTFNKEDEVDIVIEKSKARNIAYSVLMNRGYTEKELKNQDVLELVETLKNISVSPRFVKIVTNAANI